ncbi:DNA-3-methyladenine glycosylase [Streptosporangium lutulentum]
MLADGSGEHPLAGSALLTREFFDRPTYEVAPDLLGRVLVHGPVAVRLTEVEAYGLPGEDPASHTYRGRTPRNAVMFGPPGHLYVYFTYGMHFCANLACLPEGIGSGVLLRAGEVISGVEVALARRTAGVSRTVTERDLARGPARLTVALGLAMEHNGLDACVPGPISIRAGTPPRRGRSCPGRAPGSRRAGRRRGASGSTEIAPSRRTGRTSLAAGRRIPAGRLVRGRVFGWRNEAVIGQGSTTAVYVPSSIGKQGS